MKEPTKKEQIYPDLKDIVVKVGTLADFTDTLEQKLDRSLDDIFNAPIKAGIEEEINAFQIADINAHDWMCDNYESLQASIRMVNMVLADINNRLDKLELSMGRDN